MLERIRQRVARDIAYHYGFDEESILLWMQHNDVLGNRTDWELQNRPIDLDELADCYDYQTTI